MFRKDTIAAIATGLSESGISIIRISGKDAVDVADKLVFTGSGKKFLINQKSHTIHYGFVRDEQGNTVDEVMVSLFRSPRSYTTEDTVEINCHGGLLVTKKILDLVCKSGARLAEPGEFTKRAFLNGRIDLTKAEAVMDVIQAKNEMALRTGVRQLQGKLAEKIRKIRESLLYEIAYIESALDDPEHICLDGYPQRLNQKLEEILKEIQNLIASSENGKRMKEGIQTVIIGKPNAGKSSLLNLLAGRERAIVTEIAGTTRDILEESINLNGITLNVADTAGIRETDDTVEKIGVEKAKEYASMADLIIYVVDASVPLDENDEEILKIIRSQKAVVLLNKSDLECLIEKEDLQKKIGDDVPVISISTRENMGIDQLEEKIKEMFFNGEIQLNEEVIVTNMRHKEALLEAKESLQMVLDSISQDMPEDFYSIDLLNAYETLGRITGERIEDDLAEEIFSRFCMGK